MSGALGLPLGLVVMWLDSRSPHGRTLGLAYVWTVLVVCVSATIMAAQADRSRTRMAATTARDLRRDRPYGNRLTPPAMRPT